MALQLFAHTHDTLSLLEKQILQEGLEQYGLIIDPNPENKKIRNFYFHTEHPFKKSDKLLGWLDYLQFTTKPSTLESQLWVKPGQVYNANILIQNEQSLLNPLVRSFALIFPVQKTGAISNTEVDLLVVSHDIFSWQMSTYISAAGSTLGQFSLSLSQTNLLGYNKAVSVNFAMNQAIMNWGATYFDPSLFSSKNQLTLTQGVYLNRQNWGYEGLSTSLLLTYPLSTQDTPWGYIATFNYNEQPVYDFQGESVRISDGYKRQWHQLQISPQLVVTRSFGSLDKHNLSFGYGANVFQYQPLEQVSQSFIDKVLPYSEFQSFLVLGYNYFQNHFLSLYDYNTFAMTEWLQLGPKLSLTNNIALNPILGSDHTFFSPTLSLGASGAPNKDSLVSVSSQLQTRLQNTALNNQVSVTLTSVFPSLFKLGRFVLSATYAQLWNNLNHTQFALGGDSGLRGVPYRYYLGKQLLRTNLEFRTRSLPFWIFRFGTAVFYDFGAAFNDQADFHPTHDIGLGLRILTIPWNRLLIRVDAAIPVAGPIVGPQNTLLTFGIGQAF